MRRTRSDTWGVVLPGVRDGVEWDSEPDSALLRGALAPWQFALLVLVGIAGAAVTVLAIIGLSGGF